MKDNASIQSQTSEDDASVSSHLLSHDSSESDRTCSSVSDEDIELTNQSQHALGDTQAQKKNRIIDKSKNPVGSPLVGCLVLVAAGIILGVLAPKDTNLRSQAEQYLSSIIGYTYFLCWLFSFCPQIIQNRQRKSTEGLSTDFSVINVIGFACYTVYTCAFFYSKEIEREYEERFGNKNNSVQSNDVFFAVFALLMSSYQVWQIWAYTPTLSWTNDLAKWMWAFIICFVIVYSIFGTLIVLGMYGLQYIDLLYLMSSTKLFITFIKYIPQVVLNYERKNTMGWNIWNTLLDISGGILSLLQIIIDSIAMGDFTAITGNFVKFGLGLVSIVFDAIFIVQHYVIYPHQDEMSTVYTEVENV
jgi:cystinosin